MASLSRQHPLFSPIGCAGGLTLLIGIALAVIFTGGQIFSPGLLTAWAAKNTPIHNFPSHASFEPDCRQCHAPFKGVIATRCETCHAEITTERQAKVGVHGHLPEAQVQKCGMCHTDHQGRQHDPNVEALKRFDHRVSGFDLQHHLLDYEHAVLECQGCHNKSDYRQMDTGACAECHGNHDGAFMRGHLTAFGDRCMDCHDGVDKTQDFDHSTTRFPLFGQHADLECAKCHSDVTAPPETSTACGDCHKEPPAHAGVLGLDCGVCHTPDSWTPAQIAGKVDFQHTKTKFQLVDHPQDYAGAAMTCRSCHPGASAQNGDFSAPSSTCAECHSAHDQVFMDKHLLDFGPNCVSCHDGAGNMTNFDHQKFFPLEGKHVGLECAKCHIEQKYLGTARNCSGCHEEPLVHQGVFGLNCEDCHTPSAWAPALLSRHGFPLGHGQEEGKIDTLDGAAVTCATCHPANYTSYTCYGCHEHTADKVKQEHAEERLTAERLLECAACHPNGQKEEGN